MFQTFQKLDYLLISAENTFVSTDHRNLLFILNPRAFNPSVAQHIVSKVQRWALYLSQFSYCIEHVAGTDNDMLTRWCKGYRNTRKVSRISITDFNILPSVTDTDFDWPTLEEIRELQAAYCRSVPDCAERKDNLVLINDKFWIPPQANDMKLSLIVTPHTGTAGHRGQDATLDILKSQYVWKDMAADTAVFIKSCIHCIGTRSGSRVPRPLLSTTHASKPNELIHFDYLSMGSSQSGHKYVLVIKDDLSSYSWLCSTLKRTHILQQEQLRDG